MDTRFDKEDLKQAVETIKNDGIILFKDDTGWYFGASSKSEKAISKMLAIKKPIYKYELLIDNENKIGVFADDINDLVYDIFEINDNPTTIILSKKKNLNKNLIEIKEIGFRKTNNSLLSYLCNRINHPLFIMEANNSAVDYSQLQNSSTFDNQFADYVVSFKIDNNSQFLKREILRIEENGEVEIIKE